MARSDGQLDDHTHTQVTPGASEAMKGAHQQLASPPPTAR